MEFLKTKRAGALVLAMSVVFGTLYGSHRSLTTVASKITAQNEMVLKDLQTRVGVAENLYTVAKRYLSHEELAALRSDLDFLAANGNDVMAYADLTLAARSVLFHMAEVDEVTEQDRKYLSGFRPNWNQVFPPLPGTLTPLWQKNLILWFCSGFRPMFCTT